MALTETIEYDKIEVVGNYKFVQVRKATVVKKDGSELARSFTVFLSIKIVGFSLMYIIISPISKFLVSTIYQT